MSWRTSKAFVVSRKVVRTLGLRRIVSRFVLGSGYEDAFHQELMASIRPGQTVWDIGANIGYYTSQFVESAGEDGRVMAFEPSPRNLAALRDRIATCATVDILPIALGETPGTVAFLESGEVDNGVTSRISTEGGVQIEVATGDALIASGRARQPNVIKVDVEGFERDVLAGMYRTLRDPALKAAAVEIHFGMSADRGLPHAPADVERMLKDAGLSVRWTDPSHIVATRP